MEILRRNDPGLNSITIAVAYTAEENIKCKG